MTARALRVLLVANDGFSAGHVVRALAIGRGLVRVCARRGVPLAVVLATTSEAHPLMAGEPLAIARLPAPVMARRAGLSDAERRRLVRSAIAGIVDGFAPDLIVVDTFPSGPHGELAGLAGRAKRALVRRAVPEAAAADEALTAGLAGYDLAVLAGDPGPLPVTLAIPTLQVPPIALAGERMPRAGAREALGLPSGRIVLVASGGGGDHEAAERAVAIADAIARLAPDVVPVVAVGPLAPVPLAAPNGAIRVVQVAPLAPLLAAFDGAFAAAGYNTAHELAVARVPAALFAQPRPFDDQAGRAARFAVAGFARVLTDVTDDAIAGALAWMATARVPELAAEGADRAAEALIDLATGPVR